MPNETSLTEEDTPDAPVEAARPICGIIRPIAAMGDGYSEAHWLDVHAIVASAVGRAGYDLRLVSEGGAGIIVADIIGNIYNDPLLICDVSGRNPNVMFELGMRVTFEKPFIIIKDNETPFTFDITPVKHLVYRRDLRMPEMLAFQNDLVDAINATNRLMKDDNYKHYLQQFGPIQITELGSRQVDIASLAQGLDELKRSVASIDARLSQTDPSTRTPTVRRTSSGSFIIEAPSDNIIDVDVEIYSALSDRFTRSLTRLPFSHMIEAEVQKGNRTTYSIRILPAARAPFEQVVDIVLKAALEVDPTAKIDY